METETDPPDCKSTPTAVAEVAKTFGLVPREHKRSQPKVLATSATVALATALMWLPGLATAADRIAAVNPFPTNSDSAGPVAASQAHWPDEICVDGSPWRRSMDRWRQLADSPTDDSIRDSLSLPPADAPVAVALPPRRPVTALAWRPGSYQHLQTRHFNLLSRAERESTEAVAVDLERVWAVWTQLYFPLWAGRDGVDPASRHTVVLLPDARRYAMTLTNPEIAAGDRRTVLASTGFYSDRLRMSFFYPQSDPDARRHEIVHQLFAEATAGDGQSAADHEDFWLVEGVAGHFESTTTIGHLASVGGWDSPRLQYARYAAVIAGQPVKTIDQLRGDRRTVQQRDNLATWYRDAITQVHAAMDPGGRPRVDLLDRLATVYRVPDWRGAAGLKPAGNDTPIDPTAFLTVDSSLVEQTETTTSRSAICLAGMPISAAALRTLATGPPLRWLDVSRLPATDAMVERWLDSSPAVEQLSLERTAVTSALGSSIAAAQSLQSLDVSWTAIDDDFLSEFDSLINLDTLYLTGTKITDASIDLLSGLTRLKTLDVQRTAITDAGIARLSRPGLNLNPLKFE